MTAAPGRPIAYGTDQIMVGRGSPHPQAGVPAALPPANPALGDAMRNRNWSDRERDLYYQAGHAPQAHQYSRGTPHPVWGNGLGSAVSQYQPPAGPPTGLVPAGAGRVYSDPRSPAAYGVRPTFAYNRVVGTGPAPTQYAWPNMYYPGGSNTYIPSWEATGLLIKYTRDPAMFRINRYTKELKVPKDQGYYLALDGDQPYRVQSINDYLWEDSVDAPGGRQERQGFGFVPYRTARYCYPFSLGRKSVDQAEWPVLAEHAAMSACKAMTVRTLLAVSLMTTTANWSGSWGTNTAAGGAWTTSSTAARVIQLALNTALVAVEQATGGIVTDEDALQLTINPFLARAIAASPEYREYIQGSPDALAAITDYRNPNRKYGLAPYLYGLRLVVENAVVVTTPKSGNVPTPPAQTRSYVLGNGSAIITSKPQGITQSDEQSLDFSTIAFRFYENMTTESKDDPDNRRSVGRVVEDFTVTLQAPQTGYLLTSIT